MNEAEPEQTLWETTDERVLHATVKKFDEGGGVALRPHSLSVPDGVEEDIGRVWERLREANYLRGSSNFAGRTIEVLGITERGRQVASGYPGEPGPPPS